MEAHKDPPSGSARTTRVLYFINGFERGGAELGLLHLIECGAFARCEFTLASIVGGSAELIERLTKAGAPPQIFVDHARMRASDVLIAFWRLAQLMRAKKPDVLILSLPQANLVGRLIGQWFGKTTIVTFEHSTNLARRAYVKIYRWTSPCVDVIWADCQETLRVVRERHYRRPPLRTAIAPLVSLPAPPPRGADAPEQGIVCVGRLAGVKNHQLAIRAVALLRDRGKPVRLTIFGEGEERQSLTNLAADLGVAELMTMPGFDPHWWAKGHAAFLVTSTREGLCMAAIQAMWAGLPVIAPSFGGIRDYADASTMVVLDDWEVGTVAGAIMRTVSDPSLRQQLADRARERVMSLFSAERAALACQELNRCITEDYPVRQ